MTAICDLPAVVYPEALRGIEDHCGYAAGVFAFLHSIKRQWSILWKLSGVSHNEHMEQEAIR